MGVLSKVSGSVLGLGGDVFQAAPIMSSALAAGAALPIADKGVDILDSLDLFGVHEHQNDRQRRHEEDFQNMLAQKERAKKALRAQNLAKVAAAMPDVYNQVSAGRRLPKGAVVIGGKPRTDLLTALADSMASGGPIG